MGPTRIGSLFRAPFNDPDVVRAVISAAHAEGVTVFADTKLPNFRKLTLDDIADSLSMVDYITPNEDEARFFTGEDEPESVCSSFTGRVAFSVSGMAPSRDLSWPESVKMEEFS